ncbi:MAG: cobyrinate a,c-diamide synthase [Microcystaceae cyanobacterium]
MALIIAGERSGVGKTTLTLALLSYLTHKDYRVQSFKVGPDYIDPLFHTAITGYPCRNLDPILTSQTYVQDCFKHHCQDKDFAVVEGVMGLFDGVSFPNPQNKHTIPNYASTAHIARLLALNIALVIDCSRLSGSVAAIAQGYRLFDPHLTIAGVILNRVGSDRHLELLTDALNSIKMPILGIFRRQDSLTLPERHLGLVPTHEHPKLSDFFDNLATIAQTAFNWELLLPLLKSSKRDKENKSLPPFIKLGKNNSQNSLLPSKHKIAIAKDAAFNFYYPDNLDILQQLGAELIFFSPISHKNLPKDCQGIILGGGFPEVFAEALSENKSMIRSIKEKIIKNTPIYAECGGLMYLSEAIIDFQGNSYPMVGALPTTAKMGNKLVLGYRKAVNTTNHWLFSSQTDIWGHEFHRSYLTQSSPSPLLTLKSLSSTKPKTFDGWSFQRLYAAYLHLHWGSHIAIAQNFLGACLDFPR